MNLEVFHCTLQRHIFSVRIKFRPGGAILLGVCLIILYLLSLYIDSGFCFIIGVEGCETLMDGTYTLVAIVVHNEKVRGAHSI